MTNPQHKRVQFLPLPLYTALKFSYPFPPPSPPFLLGLNGACHHSAYGFRVFIPKKGATFQDLFLLVRARSDRCVIFTIKMFRLKQVKEIRKQLYIKQGQGVKAEKLPRVPTSSLSGNSTRCCLLSFVYCQLIIIHLLFTQHKTAMIDILIAHHLSIVADLEPQNSEQTRRDCFKYIDEAIDIFMRVRYLFFFHFVILSL